MDEWCQVATRYNLKIHLVPDISVPAVLIDNSIFIRPVSKFDVLARRICHEIAEAITRRDTGLQPIYYRSSYDEHHAVAQHTERLLE